MSNCSDIRAISSRFQITLPASWRKAHGIKAGDRVRVDIEGDTVLVRPLSGVLSLRGFLGKALNPEDEQRIMEEAVARHVLGLD